MIAIKTDGSDFKEYDAFDATENECCKCPVCGSEIPADAFDEPEYNGTGVIQVFAKCECGWMSTFNYYINNIVSAPIETI